MPLPTADNPIFGASGTQHTAGVVPDPGVSAGTTKYLREDATWQVPPGSASASIAAHTFVGNSTGSTAAPVAMSVADARTTLNIGSPVSIVSSATPTINVGTTSQFNITALAIAITSMTSGLTGTPTDGQELRVRIKDDGAGPYAITWGVSFIASGVATLITTSVSNKTLMSKFVYDSVAAKWILLAVDATGY